MGWETFRFGTLYLDDTPQHIPEYPYEIGDIPNYIEGKSITIGDTNSDNTITWVKPDGMNLLVADRVLLNFVSWDDLDKAGFVKGNIISIDGRQYLCRLLKVSPWETNVFDVENEWDAILDATTEDEDVWNSTNEFFWGADISAYVETCRACRGYDSARRWSSSDSSMRSPNIGFRPALELINSMPIDGSREIMLEGQRFILSQIPGPENRAFLPQLIPLGGRPFSEIPDGDIILMYSIIIDGKLVNQKSDIPVWAKDDAKIEITEKYYGEEFLIPWYISDGMATASKSVVRWGGQL